MFSILFVFKNITDRQGTPFFRISHSTHNTGNNIHNIICPHYHTTLLKHSTFYCGTQLWNTLPNYAKPLFLQQTFSSIKKEN